MAFVPVYFNVVISDIAATSWAANAAPSDGFLYDLYPQQITPQPTTAAAGLAKSRAKYRWNYMMNEFGENASPLSLSDIVYAGTPPFNDIPPDSVTFTLAYDRPAAVHTTDEVGTAYGIKTVTIDPSNLGSGYAVGDILSSADGTFTSAVILVVLAVDSAGKVIGAGVQDPGTYSILPVGTFTATTVTGGGSGAKFSFSSVTDPGLYGIRAVTRWAARALLFSGTWNYIIYDPTATHPIYPTTVPTIARNPLEILPLTIGPVAGSLAEAEGNITVTILTNKMYTL